MKPKTKVYRWILASAGILLGGTCVCLAAFFLIKIEAMSRNAVPIVSQTSQSEMTGPSAEATTVIETTLATIAGTPTDIDVDYAVDAEPVAAEPIYQQVPIDGNTFNVLLLSSDARIGQKSGRSDSMILVSYNRKLGQIKLTSFMRDTWVKIEGHGWNRINAAYAYGGVGLAINTVNRNFNLDIQNYVTIRFEQFISIVDQLGGVEVKLSAAEVAYINKGNPNGLLDPAAGLKLLNGAQTLIHCRNRKVGNGDFDRVRRQREIMLAILQKMQAIRDPIALTKLINFTLDNLETNMKPDVIFTLATEVLGADNLTRESARVPFDKTWHYANEDGRSVIQIDLAQNRTMLHDFLYR